MPDINAGIIFMKIENKMTNVKNGLIWYIWQLLPLTYWSCFSVKNGDNDIKRIVIWKMWLGRSYNINTWNVLNKIDYENDEVLN